MTTETPTAAEDPARSRRGLREVLLSYVLVGVVFAGLGFLGGFFFFLVMVVLVALVALAVAIGAGLVALILRWRSRHHARTFGSAGNLAAFSLLLSAGGLLAMLAQALGSSTAIERSRRVAERVILAVDERRQREGTYPGEEELSSLVATAGFAPREISVHFLKKDYYEVEVDGDGMLESHYWDSNERTWYVSD